MNDYCYTCPAFDLQVSAVVDKRLPGGPSRGAEHVVFSPDFAGGILVTIGRFPAGSLAGLFNRRHIRLMDGAAVLVMRPTTTKAVLVAVRLRLA